MSVTDSPDQPSLAETESALAEPASPVVTAPAPRRRRSLFLRLPLLAGLSVAMQVQVLAAAFLLCLVAGAFVSFQDARTASRDGAQLAVVSEIRTLGPLLAQATQGALTGQAAAMANLRA